MNIMPAGPGDAWRNTIRSRLRNSIRGSSIYAPLRRARLARLTRKPGTYPDWRALMRTDAVRWKRAKSSGTGPRILIATHLGLHFTINTIDSLLAVALTWRGARVEIAMCDGVLPACQMVDHALAPSVDRFARRGPQADFCSICERAGKRLYEPLGLRIHDLSRHLSDLDRRAAATRAARRAAGPLEPARRNAVEEHAFAGALRFFGRATLPDTDLVRAVLARYLAAANLSALAAQRLLANEKFDVVVAHHGIYVPQGLMADAARRAGAHLVAWHASYRKGRLIFENGDTYHRTMISEPASRWATRPLSERQEQDLDDYLHSRAFGSQDWITFQRAAPQSRHSLEQTLGLKFAKPTAIVIGNVAWDARLHYSSSAYGEMIQWAIDTAKWFAQRPEQQLIIRCHPGEVLGSPPAQERLDEAIRASFDELPKNVAVVPPESELNTYALARGCRVALVYNTKMGVELAARGMPVIVAGDAWIRGKGFSYDASSPDDYKFLLEDATRLPRLNENQITRARRYAYHFFFRRCVPVACLDTEQGWPLCGLLDDTAKRAKPGYDAGLDAICRGIMDGAPFEYEPKQDREELQHPTGMIANARIMHP